MQGASLHKTTEVVPLLVTADRSGALGFQLAAIACVVLRPNLER
jgi:hypothetical protein